MGQITKGEKLIASRITSRKQLRLVLDKQMPKTQAFKKRHSIVICLIIPLYLHRPHYNNYSDIHLKTHAFCFNTIKLLKKLTTVQHHTVIFCYVCSAEIPKTPLSSFTMLGCTPLPSPSLPQPLHSVAAGYARDVRVFP